MASAVPTSRVDVTPAAAELIDRLVAGHGPLLFHQSGGCCDGSSPMCFPLGEFRIGSSDVRLGDAHGAPFYMSGPQFAYWEHTHLTLDVVPGRGAGFSLEAPEGVRFLIRSRLFTDAETAALAPVTRGDEPPPEPALTLDWPTPEPTAEPTAAPDLLGRPAAPDA